MSKSRIKTVLLKYHDDISSSLSKTVTISIDNPGVNNIHNIRVNIKKLRALYKLLERLSGKMFSEKQHAILFKKIFRETGKLRDIQIKTKILDNYKSAESVKKLIGYIDASKEQALKSIRNSLADFNFQKYSESENLVKELITELPSAEIENECVKFIIRSAKKIKRHLESEKSTEQIHEIRKLLKELHAASDILFLIKESKALKNFLKLVKNTEENLGKWHDNIILLVSLSEFFNNLKKYNESPGKELINLENELKHQNGVMLGYLIPEIDNLLKCIKQEN
ncbi:MAG: hypothetical protein HGGPFJEG_02919 [Ignavibacteria bacterium]|nr:hypothetical protein [Ignavibacteria bacterium]